jgi:hypothetical protein
MFIEVFMSDQSVKYMMERIIKSIRIGNAGQVLTELRYGAAIYYLLAKQRVAVISHMPSISSETLIVAEYWSSPLQGIFNTLFLGEEPFPSSENIESTVSLFRNQWLQPNWSEAMILEGVVNSLSRSIVALNGLIELFQKVLPQYNLREFDELVSETSYFEQLHQLAKGFIESLPPRGW